MDDAAADEAFGNLDSIRENIIENANLTFGS
jgi:hypothetical protein